MNLELGHFFILVEPEAKVAKLLLELGLEESYSRVHPSQGTMNRCFKFSNSMMELLWLRDEEEANKGPANGLRFAERLSNENTSPFGLIFNRKNKGDLQMPFNGWPYQPDYFPVPNAFHVGSNSEKLAEPLCIYVPFMAPSLSKELLAASQADGLSVECGIEHLLEVTFDQKAKGLNQDLRPSLPLILHW